MSESGTVRPNRVAMRRPLRILPMALASLMVLLVGWSILWVFARHEAHRGFNDWLASERRQGRIWTCPGQTIDGYPLRIVIRCDRPTFADAADPEAVHGDMAGLQAEAALYFPTNVAVSFAGPMSVQERASGTDLSISWAAARLTLRGDVPGDLDRGQLEADAVAIAPRSGGATTRIGHLELGFKPLPQSATGSLDAEAVLRVTDAQSPAADAAFGSDAPIAAAASAVVTALPNGSPSLPLLLDLWRRAGGDVQFKNFRFEKGSFVVGGDGRFSLDEDHRLTGQLDTRFSGLEPVAARFGIPLGAVKIGGLLSGLLGGKPTTPQAGAADLALPLVAKNGRLYIGPVRTGVTMTPLY